MGRRSSSLGVSIRMVFNCCCFKINKSEMAGRLGRPVLAAAASVAAVYAAQEYARWCASLPAVEPHPGSLFAAAVSSDACVLCATVRGHGRPMAPNGQAGWERRASGAARLRGRARVTARAARADAPPLGSDCNTQTATLAAPALRCQRICCCVRARRQSRRRGAATTPRSTLPLSSTLSTSCSASWARSLLATAPR